LTHIDFLASLEIAAGSRKENQVLLEEMI